MSVYVSSVFAIGSGVAMSSSPVQGVLPTAENDQETEKAAKVKKMAVES